MTRTVIIFALPINTPKDDIIYVTNSDEVLHREIKIYSNELKAKDIETFKIEKNYIITEEGYKVALYEDETLIEE